MKTFWTLLKSPAFTVTAALSLALGIGASAVMFSAVHAVLFRPLPYRDSDRLVWLWSTQPNTGTKQRVSYPDFLDWMAESQSFEGMAGWGGYEATLTGAGEPEALQAGLFHGDLFVLLGVSPLVGAVGDEPQSVVISHRLWQRRFGGGRDVAGRPVRLNGQSFAIAAVMPPGFEFPVHAGAPIDMWIRLGEFNPALRSNRGARLIEVLARLKPNVSLDEAQADMNRIAARLAEQYPQTNRGAGVHIVTALEEVAAGSAQGLWALFGGVAALLLISCVNVANLLIARATARRREIAVRAALGAGRSRIALHLVGESVWLACGGAFLGGLLAFWGMSVLREMAPTGLSRIDQVRLDIPLLLFLLLTGIVAGIACGLASAWYASRLCGAETLQQSSPALSEGLAARRLSSALVIGEIALAMILLAGAGLFINSVWRLAEIDAGLDPEHILTFEINWPGSRYSQPGEAFRQLQERLLAIPGVLAASTGMQLPDRGIPMIDDVSPLLEIEGRQIAPSERPRVALFTTQPGYLRAMGIPLIRGRDFTASDAGGSPPVVIINDALARAHFRNEDPIGRRLKLESWTLLRTRTVEIVGIAGNVMHRGARTATPAVYAPMQQLPRYSSHMVVRTAGDPLQYVNAVRAAVYGLDKDQAIEDMQTMNQRIAGAIAKDRFSAAFLAAFAALALILAAIGLYGLLAYITARRTQEMAIRMALGARQADVMALVLRQGVALAAIGMAIGLAGALAITRFIEGLLFGVTPTDPLTFALATLTLAAVATAATLVPAWRAIRTNPAAALRHQ